MPPMTTASTLPRGNTALDTIMQAQVKNSTVSWTSTVESSFYEKLGVSPMPINMMMTGYKCRW
jgi:hypothetical protein